MEQNTQHLTELKIWETIKTRRIIATTIVMSAGKRESRCVSNDLPNNILQLPRYHAVEL